MPFLMTESLSNTVVTYVVLKRLVKPWTEWDAYKLGIIDDKGKRIKVPVTFEERAAWTVLDRFVHNIKRIMEKFVGVSRLASMLTSIYLLKDSVKPHIVMRVKNGEDLGCLNEMTFAKQKMLLDLEKCTVNLARFKPGKINEEAELAYSVLLTLATQEVEKAMKEHGLTVEEIEKELL